MKLLCFLFYFIFIISCNTIDNKLTLVEKEMIIYCDSVLNSHINEMKVTKFIDLYYPYLNNNIVKIKFPDLLFKFKNLNSLTITGGPFDSIPDRFREFVCLKDLTLGLSEYENLNEILKKFNKTDIETLSLILKENNKIPEECCLFDNLNTLSIYHFSKYDTLPKCLSRLNKLENLSFIFSEPKVKYNNIEKLNNLRSLTLNYCHNADLRDLFDRLSHLNHLQSLMITDDSLKDIPENVKNLDESIIDIIDWNNFFYPNGYGCFTDLLINLEGRNDLIGGGFYGWAMSFNEMTPKGFLTKCAHPSINGHKVIANELYNHIKLKYLTNE